MSPNYLFQNPHRKHFLAAFAAVRGVPRCIYCPGKSPARISSYSGLRVQSYNVMKLYVHVPPFDFKFRSDKIDLSSNHCSTWGVPRARATILLYVTARWLVGTVQRPSSSHVYGTLRVPVVSCLIRYRIDTRLKLIGIKAYVYR